MTNHPLKGRGHGLVTYLKFFGPQLNGKIWEISKAAIITFYARIGVLAVG